MPAAQFPSWEFDPSTMRVKVDVSLAADKNNINGLVESVLGLMKAMDCACDKEFEVETALREALANAIVHGCGSDPTKKIQCTVACDDDRGMLIVVRDPGAGFDLAALPNPTHAENLYADHGRGIFLINQLVDHVSHAQSGTEIRMLIRGGKACAEADIFWKS